jgi:hypothetical protein
VTQSFLSALLSVCKQHAKQKYFGFNKYILCFAQNIRIFIYKENAAGTHKNRYLKSSAADQK